VLLYAQWPSAVSRLTLDHIPASDDQVRLRLGHEPACYPNRWPSSSAFAATRRGHAALGVLAAQAPGLQSALLAAKMAGHDYAIIDGTPIETTPRNRAFDPIRASCWTTNASPRPPTPSSR
jgi:hypothetical protein